MCLDWCNATGAILKNQLCANIVTEDTLPAVCRTTQTCSVDELVPLFIALSHLPDAELIELILVDNLPPDLATGSLAKIERMAIETLRIRWPRLGLGVSVLDVL